MPELVPVLDRHRFDEAALARHLREHLPGFDGPVEVRQFQGGQSNPTFHIRTEAGEYVLRKKPPGKLLPRAHEVEREYRIIRALEGSDVPVPRARLLVEDASVIGTAFFVMDHVPGPCLLRPCDDGRRAGRPRRGVRGHGARAGGAAPRGLARRGPGRVRQARGLHGAAGGALDPAMGGGARRGDAGDGPARRVAAGAPAEGRGGDDRARRLTASATSSSTRPSRASSPCWTGSWPPSATRWPTSATPA